MQQVEMEPIKEDIMGFGKKTGKSDEREQGIWSSFRI